MKFRQIGSRRLLSCKNLFRLTLPIILGLAAVLVLSASALGVGVIALISSDSSGNLGNNISMSSMSSISSNGRYVSFSSMASNLITSDTNSMVDIFIKDVETGETVRISTDASGNEANGNSIEPSISADGRYVAFESTASNLIPNDQGAQCHTPWGIVHCDNVFMKDVSTGSIMPVSADANGNQASSAVNPSISADGRYVAFASGDPSLIPGDVNGKADVYIKDVQTGAIHLVSTDSSGGQGNDSSGVGTGVGVAVSGDGRFVAFSSQATNLVPVDTNGVADVFIKDTWTGATVRVSESVAGNQGDGQSSEPAISADGRYVAFLSDATNLVPGDNNQSTDVFVKDTQTGVISMADTDASGNVSFGFCANNNPSISADGRYVAFLSSASNLVLNDWTGWGGLDVNVKDMQTGAINMLDRNSLGSQGDSSQYGFPAISADGRYVAFDSAATNLVTGDTNGTWDVFLSETSMPITGGKPNLGLARQSVYWQSYQDYQAGLLSVDFQVTNSGGNPAYNVKVNSASATNGATVASSMPVSLGNMTPGSSHSLTIKFNIPTGISSFVASTTATANDGNGVGYSYP